MYLNRYPHPLPALRSTGGRPTRPSHQTRPTHQSHDTDRVTSPGPCASARTPGPRHQPSPGPSQTTTMDPCQKGPPSYPALSPIPLYGWRVPDPRPRHLFRQRDFPPLTDPRAAIATKATSTKPQPATHSVSTSTDPQTPPEASPTTQSVSTYTDPQPFPTAPPTTRSVQTSTNTPPPSQSVHTQTNPSPPNTTVPETPTNAPTSQAAAPPRQPVLDGSPAVYMSYMSQNFCFVCLFPVSSVSVLNFRIFLLMYPESSETRRWLPRIRCRGTGD